MQSLTSPLGLQTKLVPPNDKLEMAPFFNGLLIAFLLYVFGSSFFFAQGTAIALPSGRESVVGQPANALLTVTPSGLCMANGRLFSLKNLDSMLAEVSADVHLPHPTLLVKADHAVDIQTLLQICDSAKRAGFYQIQIAADYTDATQQ